MVESNGRCYCQHEVWASCTINYRQYTAYEFEQGPNEAPPPCHMVTFETLSSHSWAKTAGSIAVDGYGVLPSTCHDSTGASCDVNVCSNSLKVATLTGDGWLFKVKVQGKDITANGASHVNSTATSYHRWGELDDDEADVAQEWSWDQQTPPPSTVPTDAPTETPTDLPPSSQKVGTGLCQPLGIRVYEGNGDNDGTTQQRTDRCASACFSKKPALDYGPWSTRADAVGFGMVESTGRCYCQHEVWASCTTDHSQYTAYELERAPTDAPVTSAPTNTVPTDAPTDAIQPDLPPSSQKVGTGLCKPLGIRVYEGNGDNDGTTQQRTD